MDVKERLPELDALRGLAALSVCFFHFSTFNYAFFNLRYFRFGVTGVDLFFLISGFVIFMSITKIQQLRDFWIARISRLYPAYWVSIIIAVTSFYFFRSNTVNLSPNYVIGNLLMVQPLLRAKDLVEAYWTLYIELNFYLFISAVWYLKKINNIENTVLAGLLIMLCFNGYYLVSNSALYQQFFISIRGVWPLLSHFHLFAAGIIFYKVYQKGYSVKRVLLITVCFFTILIVHPLGGRVVYFLSAREHLLVTGFYFFIFFLLVSKKLSFLKVKWLTFFGTISYSLYLLHQSLGLSLSNYLQKFTGSTLSITTGIGCSVLLAALITYSIEKPILKWSRVRFKTYGKKQVEAEGFI